MVLAGTILKCLCLKLFCATFLAHLSRNCVIKLKPHFEDVDQLIAMVKSAKVKNKTKQAKFGFIGCPPQPVVAR